MKWYGIFHFGQLKKPKGANRCILSVWKSLKNAPVL